MAVVTVVNVVNRRFRGYDDPRYPTGIWLGQGITTGDASGGDNTLQLQFGSIGQVRNSQFYNLEQVSIGGSTTVATVAITMGNFDNVVTASLVSTYSADLRATQDAGIFALTPQSIEGLRGLYIGQQSVEGTALAIAITVENNDLEVIRATLQGYIWSARSINADGGPQRPPSRLFR